MFEHLHDEYYKKFKGTYRLKRYRNTPINNLQVIAHLAYLDIVVAFIRTDLSKNNRDEFKNVAINFLKDIKDHPPNNQDEFDRRHDEACEKCCAVDNTNIFYGHAQKLINMSLKYFYNEYALYSKERNYLNYPNNNVEFYFHLPIDTQVITCFKKLNKLKNFHKFDVPEIPFTRCPGERYVNFQNQLRSRLINNYKPLEIDYFIWNKGPDYILENARLIFNFK